MPGEITKIIVVEDDNRQYSAMLPFLEPLSIKIQRINNRKDVLILVDALSERVFWIIDGNFPKFPGERTYTCGPHIIEHIQQEKKGHAGIVGFTSDPKIFKGITIPVFDKQYFSSSMGEIVKLILQAQQS